MAGLGMDWNGRNGMAKPDFAHGVQGYNWHKCRCEQCRAANSARSRTSRAARKARTAAGDPAVPHGTRGGYTNWACRCLPCSQANSEACLEYRNAHSNRQDIVT
jgi:hypothetical protein